MGEGKSEIERIVLDDILKHTHTHHTSTHTHTHTHQHTTMQQWMCIICAAYFDMFCGWRRHKQ